MSNAPGAKVTFDITPLVQQAVSGALGTSRYTRVALVDIAVWHWMYEHPNSSLHELREATLRTAREVWNQYYAPVLGGRDSTLLGIYSHMINYPLYLFNYPLGHLIAFQIEEHVKKAGPLGPEFERMALSGSVVPDLWMKKATGAPVGPEALLTATSKALKEIAP